ncbi:hypothetical protein E4U14_001064, partial [Claviceps sp. LM454 group G7]
MDGALIQSVRVECRRPEYVLRPNLRSAPIKPDNAAKLPNGQMAKLPNYHERAS